MPIGTPLGEIIYDIGGGIPNNKKFKAAQIGGPSGGCIPREHLNVPVDYETLSELGAIMGSGGLIVMDEDTCMVDMARFFLDFVQDESCGKCVPCRIGTKRMLEIVTRICEGKGEEGDVEKLIALGQQIKDTALCGLGQTAPNPVLSTIRHFARNMIFISGRNGVRRRLPGTGARPVERVPGQCLHSGFRFPRVGKTLRGSIARPPRQQSLRIGLRARVLPHLRRQMPTFQS